MPRIYTHVKLLEKEIFSMRTIGKTYREIAEYFGFKDKYVVREFIKRKQRQERYIEAGIVPGRRGRPPKGYQPTEQEKDNEIKRLRMENELLRDFLRLTGRR
jgi:hypothetical protein